MLALSRWSLLLLLLALTGCGYRPMGSPSLAPQEIPSLAIPLFENRSTEVGLEAIMANALIQAFSQSRAVHVVTKPESADLVLEGKVKSVQHSSVAFLDVTRSTVRRVTIRVDFLLKRRPGDKVVWKDTIEFEEDYVVDPNYQIGETTRTQGIRRGTATMAQRIKDKVLLVI
jgi:outer membrane lipopolysaccharide assembly protein LptE/RlpB